MMNSAKKIKATLRARVEVRMQDFRELDACNPQYKHIAYGAIWAASWAQAITEKEREAYLAELFPKKNQQHGQPAPMQRAA